jgi:hypothetical protein
MTIITPAKPITTDASRTKVMRSPSNGQARKVTASGETKEMAIASVTPTYLAELKKNSVEPSRPAEQITCCTGERVRSRPRPLRGRKTTHINTRCTASRTHTTCWKG